MILSRDSMNIKRKISVVITTYERGEPFSKDNFLIRRALKSVFSQTYPIDEIIIVVDGVSSFLQDIVDQFEIKKSKKIKVIQTKNKVGGSQARNIGINAATNSVVSLLDDDDEWLNNKIDEQMFVYEKQISDTKNFVVFSPMYVGENKSEYMKRSYNVNENIANYVLCGVGSVQTSSLLFNKFVFKQQEFKKDLLKHQDWDWVFSLFFNNQTHFFQTKKVTLIYHTDASQLLSVGKRYSPLFSFKWIMEYKHNISKQAFYLFLWSFIVSPTIHKKDKIDKKIKVFRYVGFALVTRAFLY
ncbi:MAG: glycosyltransferase family 2 protein, partial [Oenococcus oeni]